MARPRTDIAPRIVHAARGRFLTEGVDGASLRTIAKDAGTSVGMIYYYFPTKDDLFLAIVEEKYSELLHELEKVLAAEGDTRSRAEKMYARLGALTSEEIDVVRLVVREALVSSTRLDRLLERFARGHLPLLLGVIGEGVEKGELVDDVPVPLLMMSLLATGAIPQIARRVIAERMPAFAMLPSGEALAETMVRVVFEGIAKKKKKPPPG